MTSVTIAPLFSTGWLRDAPDAWRMALLAAAVPRHYAAGTVFWQAGDTGEGLLGIVSGQASLLHALARPDSPILHIVGPGFWGGNGPLLSDGPLAMTLVARTEVHAALVPRRAVLAILAAQPELWREIGRLTLEHVWLPTMTAADLMIHDSRQRCAATLLRLCGWRHAMPPRGERVEVAMTQDELAGMATLSRASVGPILKDLAADGLISVGYRSIAIRDVAGLQRVADADSDLQFIAR